MSTRPDLIAVRPVRVPARPFYALGVLLDAEDFEAEQGYQRGRYARALKYLLGTGTIAGLRVSWRPESAQLAVGPGLALDPLGRLIEIARPVSIRLRGGPGADDSWFDMQLDADLAAAVAPGPPAALVADVFVRATVCERSRAPAFANGPFDARKAAIPQRLRDGYEVALVLRTDLVGDDAPSPDDLEILGTRPNDAAAALQWARERILAAWRDRSQDWTGNDDPLRAHPRRLPEHLALDRSDPVSFPVLKDAGAGRSVVIHTDPSEVGRDPTSVLLARVRIPVNPATQPPSDLGVAPSIDNLVRRFIRSSGVYVQPRNGGSP